MPRRPSIAYLDISCLIAAALGEPGGGRLVGRLERYDRLLASNVLEAEFRATLVRERVTGAADSWLSAITWVHPDRPLTAELRRIAAAGPLAGTAMWHLAHALYLAPDGKGLDFLTLDRRQREIASALGLVTVELGSTRRR
ncbi:MAG TPA: PIN domain-containing protein [bacterium]|nr:PIN domain-containing protein [bacterium]